MVPPALIEWSVDYGQGGGGVVWALVRVDAREY